MAQPAQNEGSRQMAMVQVETAMQMLEQALPGLGSTSEEGRVVLRAMSSLSTKFNRAKAQELVPAQIAQMAQSQQQSPLASMLAAQAPGAPGGAPGAPAPQPQ